MTRTELLALADAIVVEHDRFFALTLFERRQIEPLRQALVTMKESADVLRLALKASPDTTPPNADWEGWDAVLATLVIHRRHIDAVIAKRKKHHAN